MTNDWIEWHWTPEKPYPETLDTKVVVMFADGSNCISQGAAPEDVSYWYECDAFDKSRSKYYITHYKLA